MVVSVAEPPGLLVYNASLELVYTLNDVASDPHTGHPVFDLGPRLLAYATTKEVSSRTGVSRRDIASHLSDGRYQDAAKGVAKEMVSGVRTLGGYGYQAVSTYWRGSRQSPPSARSAPSISHMSLSPDSASVSPPAQVRLTSSARRRSSMQSLSGASGSLEGNLGSVMIRDLDLYGNSAISIPTSFGTQPPIFAHFEASPNSLSTIAFNQSNTLLFTSSIKGHSFNIFEIRRRALFPKSDTSRRTNHRTDPRGSIRHVYKLFRGYTGATVHHAAWSSDSKYIAVITSRGTAHVFALNPIGGNAVKGARREYSGAARLERVKEMKIWLGGKVPNFDGGMYPKSISMTPILRLRPRRLQVDNATPSDVASPDLLPQPDEIEALPLTLLFLDESVSRSLLEGANKAGSDSDEERKHRSRRPSQREDSRQRTPSESETFPTLTQDILTVNPNTGKMMLSRCLVTASTSVSAIATATVSSAAQSLASTAASAANATVTRATGNNSRVTRTERNGTQQEPRPTPMPQLVGKYEDIADWKVQREDAWNEIAQDVKRLLTAQAPRQTTASNDNHLVEAEIETFNPSPMSLPPPIWLSHQFTFHAVVSEDTHDGIARELVVRKQVVGNTSQNEVLENAMTSPLATSGAYPPLEPIQIHVNTKRRSWREAVPVAKRIAAGAAKFVTSNDVSPRKKGSDTSVSFEDAFHIEEGTLQGDISAPLVEDDEDEHAWDLEVHEIRPGRDVGDEVAEATAADMEGIDWLDGQFDEIERIKREPLTRKERLTEERPAPTVTSAADMALTEEDVDYLVGKMDLSDDPQPEKESSVGWSQWSAHGKSGISEGDLANTPVISPAQPIPVTRKAQRRKAKQQ